MEAFVDRVKKGWFAGKPIIKSKDIEKYTYDKILVMILNNEERLEVKEYLKAQGIESKKILDGSTLYR